MSQRHSIDGYEHVEWLLIGEPRAVQLEAVSRSIYGLAIRDHWEVSAGPRRLPHYGAPARGWAHFMQMRLGKTPTALNEFLLLERDFGIRKLLVIAPNKYKAAWVLEAQRFGLVHPMHVAVLDRSGTKSALEFMRRPSGMMSVNYEALLREDPLNLLTDWVDERTMVVADESVMIKAHDKLMARNALSVGKEAGFTRVLTGKPNPQSVADFYSQLRFARQLNGVNYYAFKNTFALTGGFKGKQITGYKNEDRFNRLLDGCSFRAQRKNWSRYIQPDYESFRVAMSPRQKEAYAQMEDEFVVWLDNEEVVTAEQVLTKHLKLQQISSGFIYDERREPHWLETFDKTAKFLEVVDRLDNYYRDKVILIAFYKPTLERLTETMAKYNPAMILSEPEMKRRGIDVEDEKRRFNEDPSCRLIIGQMTAIKYGHTLIGTPEDPCLSTIYYERTYSLDDRKQTEERNQHVNQTEPVNLLDLYSTPAEAKVIEALQRKEDVSQAILDYYGGMK